MLFAEIVDKELYDRKHGIRQHTTFSRYHLNIDCFCLHLRSLPYLQGIFRNFSFVEGREFTIRSFHILLGV